jgi:2-haloacid dehalogenase
MTTPIPPHLKILFFDVFGTCVAQITPVADELHKATQEALESSSITDDVRAKAAEMVPQFNREIYMD